jgi:hypothetical protein
VSTPQAQRLLNHYRLIAGLTTVKLDRQLSTGCMEHANYMVQNQGTDAMAGLNPHTQRSHLPGASAAGAACAKAADLFIGVSDLGVAIDVWMAGMYHRRPMLDPQLERIGVGYARLPTCYSSFGPTDQELMVEIDRSKLQRSEAQLEMAELTLKNKQGLHAKKIISETEVFEAQASRDIAAADVVEARLRCNYQSPP